MRRTFSSLARGDDVAGRGAVGVAEAGLADGVDQVVDVCSIGPAPASAARGRIGIRRVQPHHRDFVIPSELGQPSGVAGGWPAPHGRLANELRYQTRSDVAGGARHQTIRTPLT